MDHHFANFQNQAWRSMTPRRDHNAEVHWSNRSKFLHDVEHHEAEKEELKHVLGTADFSGFADEAYRNRTGYAIRNNPLTGQKEMFVAGTRTPSDWALNALDLGISVLEKPSLFIPKVAGERWVHALESTGVTKVFRYLDPVRVRQKKKLERIAKAEGVEVIYGHSRGGAIVADMQTSATKVGLDAAMMIASNKEMLNLQETQLFDKAIGFGGEMNEEFDLGPKFHRSWE